MSWPKECLCPGARGPFFLDNSDGRMCVRAGLMSATADTVVIGDPLSGVREMTMRELRRKWKGTAISLSPR